VPLPVSCCTGAPTCVLLYWCPCLCPVVLVPLSVSCCTGAPACVLLYWCPCLCPVVLVPLPVSCFTLAPACVLLYCTYRVSQEEWTKLRESVPYVELYRYNPKHLYPKLNGYGDNGQRKVLTSCISAYCTSSAVAH